MKQTIRTAREKLWALPKWLKIAMWAQVMLVGTIGFIGLGGVLAVQTDQLMMISNAASALPDDSEIRAQLIKAIALGAHDGRYWMLQLVVGLTASVVIGLALGFFTPWKQPSKDDPIQNNEPRN